MYRPLPFPTQACRWVKIGSLACVSGVVIRARAMFWQRSSLDEESGGAALKASSWRPLNFVVARVLPPATQAIVTTTGKH